MKRFVLIHHYCETGKVSIVAFSDSEKELIELKYNQPHVWSFRHRYCIVDNVVSPVYLSTVKDRCLINICKNVAEYLSIAEYAMLKKSYFKSQAWFERAKDSCFIAADILDNY